RVGEIPPIREGDRMIWLPRADQPLVFSSPTNFSLGYVGRGRAARRRVALTDAGGGAGVWSVSLKRMLSGRGVSVSAPPAVTVPGGLMLSATATPRPAAADASGFVVRT